MTTPLQKWVDEQAKLAKPDSIHWCDGSDADARWIMENGLKKEKIGPHFVFTELNQKTFPQSYLHRSHPTDVARTEHLTYICSPDKKTAGPNNNWMDPREARKKLTSLSNGCMKGKTMYVLPYMMGHPDSPYAKACIQVTDISYVAVSMQIMTRLHKRVIDKIGNSDNFIKGFHSVGDFSPDKRYIMHFPQDSLVWSIGSGYGGNALLGKKCISLRIASWLGLQQDWMAEHMLIIGIEDPQGKISYIAAAFPSACGKTNLAMLQSTLPGYKIWTLGDDIAWLHIGPDGRLWAINPEAGFFGVAPGTSIKNNPNMIKTLKAGTFYPTLYTNTALNTDTNEPWWEGLDGPVPEHLLDWQGKPWDPKAGQKAAHPNSRFTVSISQCPVLSPEYDTHNGVPISAIIFGGRRTRLMPLVCESFNWQNGVFCGARMGSETTAAATVKVGQLRRDPMAMRPFCSYNMGDYFEHWLAMGEKIAEPPKIFTVNWFRTDKNGKFIWPGFSENIRVLKWIIDRVNKPSQTEARETPIGLIPGKNAINLSGLDVSQDNMEKMFQINKEDWQEELEEVRSYFSQYGDHLPQGLWDEFNSLKNNLRI